MKNKFYFKGYFVLLIGFYLLIFNCKSSFYQQIQKNIIKEHTVWTELENFGKVYFVSCQKIENNNVIFDFYLFNKNKDLLYHFDEDKEGYSFNTDRIIAISFMDINCDKKKDIIILFNEKGHGAYPVIFFNEIKKFSRNIRFELDLFYYFKGNSIKELLELIKYHQIHNLKSYRVHLPLDAPNKQCSVQVFERTGKKFISIHMPTKEDRVISFESEYREEDGKIKFSFSDSFQNEGVGEFSISDSEIYIDLKLEKMGTWGISPSHYYKMTGFKEEEASDPWYLVPPKE